MSTSRGTALTVAGMFFLLLLDGTILNTSLPRMAEGLGVETLELSSAVTGYLLATAATLPLSPWFAQRFGARRVYFCAVLVFVLASAACGLALDLPQLVVARVVQGCAGGLVLATGRIIALRKASKAELLSLTALLVWPALMAPVLGPPLGGFITSYFSWRWNFLMNVPLGLAGLLSILRFIARDEPAERRAPPLDRLGALLTAAGLGLLLAGLETSAHAAAGSPQRRVALAMTVLGALLLAWDAWHLTRTPHPLLSLAPLSVRTFAVSTLATGTFSAMCLHATPYLLPLMFQLAFGLNAAEAGALLLPYFLGNLMMKSVTTPLLRRFGFRAVLLVDGVVAMLAIGLCATLGPATPYPLLCAILLVAGAARSMLFTSLNTLSLADIELHERGAASTLGAISQQLAAALGVALSTWLLALFQAQQGRDALALHDFRLAFLTVGAIGLASVAGYLRIGRDAGAEVSGHRMRAAPAKERVQQR